MAVAGWKEITRVDAADLAEQVKGWGVPRIQYTDVMRDGTLMGPNVAGIEKLARQCGLRITAAGGISILEDLTRLQRAGAASAWTRSWWARRSTRSASRWPQALRAVA